MQAVLMHMHGGGGLKSVVARLCELQDPTHKIGEGLVCSALQLLGGGICSRLYQQCGWLCQAARAAFGGSSVHCPGVLVHAPAIGLLLHLHNCLGLLTCLAY